MEGFGIFFALTFILVFFAIFFTIQLLMALVKIRVNWVRTIFVGCVSFLLGLLLFGTDWLFEIDIRIILLYSVIVFFAWLLCLAFRKNN